MSYRKSFKELEIKLQQKNIILISGNVYDVFKKEGSRDLDDLTKKIFEIISSDKMNFKCLEKFSSANGKLTITENGLKEEEGNKDFLTFLTSTLSAIEKHDFKIENKKSFLIDFNDVYFNSKNSESDLSAQIGKILSLYLDNWKVDKDKNNIIKNNFPKLILVQRDSGSITDLLQRNNIEYANVNISLPNNEERSEFLVSFSKKFHISNDEELMNVDSKDHLEAVALTSRLSSKEILQFGRIEPNIEMTFKELYSLAILNKKESEWTNLSKDKVITMKDNFKDNLFGQDFAIEAVYKTLIRSILGMSGATHSNSYAKPKGVLYFAGPTGVGKTELAKLLTNEIFGDESKMIRFDMSEYNHEESDQKLIGAAPGYVGYDAGGKLTNQVKENPFSILLFDEIEKAHPKILDKFLQILEDGRLTSSKGELVDFSETFIIFTSNIGQNETSSSNLEEKNRDIFITKVKEFFNSEKIGRPELLNRIGVKNIIPFNYITDKTIISKLIKNKLAKVNKQVKELHNINILDMTEPNYNEFIDKINESYDEKYGGRGLITSLETEYVDKLAEFIFNENLFGPNKTKEDKTTNIEVTMKATKIIFQII